MSTMTGAAPRIRLDGPLPRPPLYTLVSVAQEAPSDAHWRAGANLRPYPPDVPNGHDPCSTGSLREKDDPEGLTLPDTFPTFTAYLGEVCTASGIGAWDAFTARSKAALAARVSYALERQLVDAEFVDAPHMGDDDVTLLGGGTATPVVTALGYLEDHLASSAQDGVIHLTPSAAAVLGFERLRDDRGVLRTARGTPVAVGDGYVGSDVPTSGGSADTAAAAGQSWLYVTGPVLYRLDSEIVALPETIAEALDREINEVVYRAEQDLWVAWDKQIQGAVLADWSP